MESFDKIHKRAAERKGGKEQLDTLLGEVGNNADVAHIPDDRVLSLMAARIFSAGFVWRVIEQKWPGFEEAFLNFEPGLLLFQPDEFWEERASDTRIVRHGAKIKSVRDNARFIVDTTAAHGSFGNFLSEWPADDQVGLLAHLNKYGSRLGGATGQYFLRFLGWDGFVTSKDMVAAMRGAGLSINEKATSKKDLTAIQNQINNWVQETGMSRAHISRILAMSVGENYQTAP